MGEICLQFLNIRYDDLQKFTYRLQDCVRDCPEELQSIRISCNFGYENDSRSLQKCVIKKLKTQKYL